MAITDRFNWTTPMTTKMKFVKFYPADALQIARQAGLTSEERRAYNDLLIHAIDMQGALPREERRLWSLLGAIDPKEQELYRTVLSNAELFTLDAQEDVWRCPFALKLIDEATAKHETLHKDRGADGKFKAFDYAEQWRQIDQLVDFVREKGKELHLGDQHYIVHEGCASGKKTPKLWVMRNLDGTIGAKCHNCGRYCRIADPAPGYPLPKPAFEEDALSPATCPISTCQITGRCARPGNCENRSTSPFARMSVR